MIWLTQRWSSRFSPSAFASISSLGVGTTSKP